ncbi:MAG: aminotransferase class I/II-fold pyridoxal phosphate-dependent enzyme [Limisphaerales bacterium]
MKTELLTPAANVPRPSRPAGPARIELATATERDREVIYRLRHEVFARELGQHRVNPAGQLRDALDDWNTYLVAKVAGTVAGFISLTPPTAPSYSMDKYVPRDRLPFAFDAGLFEARLLTVMPDFRGSEVAALLMYAAFRWVEAHGGTRLMAIGRREVVDLYLRGGLEPVGLAVQSGAVTYDVLQASVAAVRARVRDFGGLHDRLEGRVDWQLTFPFRQPAACFHGGAFFASIGPKFDRLERRHDIINADVLDAWFPPSPKVLAALNEHLPWLLRTSPPTDCEGLVETIAVARGVAPANILPGAGSSDLIFRALRHWLTPASHALILDPTYGEYAHVLERVIGCTVDRLTLSPQDDFAANLSRLAAALADGYDLVVLVNPNSPTGRHIPRAPLEAVLRRAPERTRVWVDETYVEYAGPGESLERFAAASENVLVCKSLSKVYALSGARAAYLCAGPHQLEALRAITPPWVVGLPAQVAAVHALQDLDYYAARHAETHGLREDLAKALRGLGLRVVPGIANFVLCELPAAGPNAATVVTRCRERGLFLRDASVMGASLGRRSLRIAVKDAATNARMVEVLESALA